MVAQIGTHFVDIWKPFSDTEVSAGKEAITLGKRTSNKTETHMNKTGTNKDKPKASKDHIKTSGTKQGQAWLNKFTSRDKNNKRSISVLSLHVPVFFLSVFFCP